MRRLYFLSVFLLLTVMCSGKMEVEFRLKLPEKDFAVGYARMDITPHPYNEDGSCDTDYCFEVPIDVSAPHCEKNKPYTFEGLLTYPEPSTEECRDGFFDVNGNGVFDAMWLGGFDFARPATGYDKDAPTVVRAGIIATPSDYIVLVSIDTIGLSPIHLANLRDRIEGVSDGTVKKDRVLIMTIHNHEAPDLQGLWGPDLVHNVDLIVVGNIRLYDILRLPGLTEDIKFPLSGFIPDYWKVVEDKVVLAIKDAVENMRSGKYVKFMEAETPHKEEGCLSISVEGEFQVDCNGDGFFNEGIDLDLYKEGIYVQMNVDCDNDGDTDRDDIELYNLFYKKDTYGETCTGGSINSVWENLKEKAERYNECFTPLESKTHKFLERYLITDGRFPFVIDYNVYAIQFLDENQSPLLTFVVWGNHAEVMEQDNTAISGDYPGYLCNYIEEKTGGGCIFQIGPEGGLTTPLGTCIPKMDEEGNFILRDGTTYVDEREIDFLAMNNLKPAIYAKERAESLGRYIGKFVLVHLDEIYPYALTGLDIEVKDVLLPFENPMFYAAARLNILKGGSVLVSKNIDAEKVSDLVYKKELSANNNACGPIGCFKLPIHLVTLRLERIYERIKVGFITTPAEFFPEYGTGRDSSIIYFASAPPGMEEIPDDPNYPDVFTTGVNPLRPMRIEGLISIAKEKGYRSFFILAETNSTIGYTPPRTDFLPVYEGIFDQIKQFSDLIDIIMEHNGGVYRVFELPYSDKEVTFTQLMDDTWVFFGEILQDVNPPDRKLDMIRHPNEYEETVSLGPRTGDILYNFLRSFIEEKDYTPYVEVPDDPMLNQEVMEVYRSKE